MRDRLLPTRTRAQIAADNRAELDAWIDERAEQLIARGLDATEARRRALDEFGDVALAERYAEHEDVTADPRVPGRPHRQSSIRSLYRSAEHPT